MVIICAYQDRYSIIIWKKARIVLADDQLLVRQGMRALLDTLPQYEAIAECAKESAAMEGIYGTTP